MRKLGVSVCRSIGMADHARIPIGVSDSRKESCIPPRLIVFLLVAPLIILGCSSSGPEGSSPMTGSEVVARMIEAHGGLERWRSAPTVSFEETYLPAGGSRPRVARVTVEQRTRRAYLEFPEMDARISWDGKQAWSENWQSRTPPRFVALLSYYFVNLPWLAADSGVVLGEPGIGRLWDDPTDYVTVKMTFEPGVGDTPDDYYVLYIDPNSYQLRANEYIVTYADFLPPDVDASPPFVLVYEKFTVVDGLTVPTKCSAYDMDHSPHGSRELRDWSFSKPFDESRMVMPSNAVVDTSNPTQTAKTQDSSVEN